MKRMCDGFYAAGWRAHVRCRYPARWVRDWLGERLYVCGYHARAYMASTLTPLEETK